MRLIGELPEKSLAKRFSAYLMTKKITSKIEEEGGLFEIWVKEEDEKERAVAELEKFQSDPNHSRYQDAFDKAAEISREEERKRRQFKKNVVKVNQQAGIGKRAPLTTMLIALSCIVALLTNFGNDRDSVAMKALSFTSVYPQQAFELIEKYDVDDAEVRLASIKRGEIWRLITPIFVHFGPWHILFNMLWLFQFGKLIENRYGMFWFAILVLIVAAISNLFQCLVPPDVGGSLPGLLPDNHLIMLLGGMSGVIYGLFGFIWVKSLVDPSSRFQLPQSTILILIAWLFVGGFFLPGIANWAHGVGLVVGMVAGYLPINLDRVAKS